MSFFTLFILLENCQTTLPQPEGVTLHYDDSKLQKTTLYIVKFLSCGHNLRNQGNALNPLGHFMNYAVRLLNPSKGCSKPFQRCVSYSSPEHIGFHFLYVFIYVYISQNTTVRRHGLINCWINIKVYSTIYELILLDHKNVSPSSLVVHMFHCVWGCWRNNTSYFDASLQVCCNKRQLCQQRSTAKDTSCLFLTL